MCSETALLTSRLTQSVMTSKNSIAVDLRPSLLFLSWNGVGDERLTVWVGSSPVGIVGGGGTMTTLQRPVTNLPGKYYFSQHAALKGAPKCHAG